MQDGQPNDSAINEAKACISILGSGKTTTIYDKTTLYGHGPHSPFYFRRTGSLLTKALLSLLFKSFFLSQKHFLHFLGLWWTQLWVRTWEHSILFFFATSHIQKWFFLGTKLLIVVTKGVPSKKDIKLGKDQAQESGAQLCANHE